jgi:hypothetical protein
MDIAQPYANLGCLGMRPRKPFGILVDGGGVGRVLIHLSPFAVLLYDRAKPQRVLESTLASHVHCTSRRAYRQFSQTRGAT